jgi:hypothetical protein
MATPLTCSSCGHTLRIAGDETDRWLTCPRCLARVVNPNALMTADARRERAAEPSGEEPICPECGREVKRSWRMCPFCEAPLRRARARSLPSVDDEVRRDTTGLGIGLIVLAVLGGVGIIVFLCGGGLKDMRMADTQAVAMGAILFGIFLLVPAIAGIVLTVRGREPGSRILGGILGAVGVGLLVAALGVSFLIYTVSSCLAPCDKKNPPASGQPPQGAPRRAEIRCRLRGPAR